MVGPASAEVDKDSRFPSEAIEALRADEHLSALVPLRLGGGGQTLAQVADATANLARHCASTAMIYAMHHLQVACLDAHGRSDYFECYLRDLSIRQLLLASATTELGTGGDIRSSICAIDRASGRYWLEKQAPVVSYGQYADAISRLPAAAPTAPPTNSHGVLHPAGASARAAQRLGCVRVRGRAAWFPAGRRRRRDRRAADPFDTISAQTNLPIAHICGPMSGWVWRPRRQPGPDLRPERGPQEAGHHSARRPPPRRTGRAYLQMAILVRAAARKYDEICNDPDALSALTYTISMNALKVSASTMVVDIVSRALIICGMAGYIESSPFSMGRLLRDAYGAAAHGQQRQNPEQQRPTAPDG